MVWNWPVLREYSGMIALTEWFMVWNWPVLMEWSKKFVGFFARFYLVLSISLFYFRCVGVVALGSLNLSNVVCIRSCALSSPILKILLVSTLLSKYPYNCLLIEGTVL